MINKKWIDDWIVVKKNDSRKKIREFLVALDEYVEWKDLFKVLPLVLLLREKHINISFYKEEEIKLPNLRLVINENRKPRNDKYKRKIVPKTWRNENWIKKAAYSAEWVMVWDHSYENVFNRVLCKEWILDRRFFKIYKSDRVKSLFLIPKEYFYDKNLYLYEE